MEFGPPRDVFVAFEGGGAIGFAHIGVLAALEGAKASLRPVAYAGTSAGSMIAALAAAGWRSTDLLSGVGDTANSPLLRQLELSSATELFDRHGWSRIRGFRTLIADLRRQADALVAGLGLAVLLLFLTIGWRGMVFGLLGALLILAALLAWFAHNLCYGGAGMAGVRDAFDRALRSGPRLRAAGGGTGPKGEVLFRDLPNLKICATNLTRSRLELFSAQTTPEVPVADAICASCCYPFAFAPYSFVPGPGREKETFLDGGLLCNLPAWPFDEERRLNPDSLTLAIATLLSDAEGEPSQMPWWLRMIRTTIFGHQALYLRGVGPVELLTIPVSGVEVFDFDLPAAEVATLARDARLAADILLARQVTVLPAYWRALSEAARQATQEWAERHPDLFLPLAKGEAPWFRAALAVPEDHIGGGLLTPDSRPPDQVNSLTLRFGAGYEGACDAGRVMDLETIAGEVWRSRSPAVLPLRGTMAAPWPDAPPYPGPADMAWQFATAVTLPLSNFRNPAMAVQAALVVDGNLELALAPSERFDEAFEELHAALQDLMAQKPAADVLKRLALPV